MKNRLKKANCKLMLSTLLVMSISSAYAAESYFTPMPSVTLLPPPTLTGASNTAANTTPVAPSILPAPGKRPANLGPGSAAPTIAQAFSSLLQGLEVVSNQIGTLDTDVKSSNALNNTAWNNFVTIQANELYPAGSDNYLENGSAFQSMNDLANLSFNNTTNAITGGDLIASEINCDILSDGCNPANLQTYSVSNLLSTAQYQNNSINAAGFINTLFQSVQMPGANQSQNLANAAILSTAYTAMRQIINSRMGVATNNSASSTNNAASSNSGTNAAAAAPSNNLSQVALMQNIVNTTMQQPWLSQIATASNPQLLRSIAVLLAYNNYMDVQRYQQEQTTQMLLAAQVVQLTKIANLLAAQNKQ